jgi:ethanolamine utilization microcompartment shell protein EutS
VAEDFELRFRVSLGGKDEVTDFFDKSEKSAARFQSSLKSLGSAMSTFANKAGSQFQAFAGKELGGSFGSQARGVLQLRDAINQLAVSSGKGGEIVGGLKDQIQSVSVASNQMQTDVTEALQAFVEKTGDLDTARKNIELYGKAATATSAALADISRVGVELSDKLGIKEQANAFAILATQSKQGAIELKDLATKGPRIFAAAASAGATGELGLREAGALAQTYAKAFGGIGSAASVATAVENTFSGIAKKRSRLEGAGIKFTDAEGKERDRFDVLFDIIRATKGDETKLREVFTQQGMRGVMVLANEFKKTGGFGTFERFRDVRPDAGVLDRDFATRSSTGMAKLKAEEIRRAAFADRLGFIAEFGAEHAFGIQAGIKGLGILGGGLSKLGGRVPGGLGRALSAATAQHVIVDNWPPGFGGNGGAAPLGGGKAGRFLGKALAATGVGLAAYEGTQLIDELTGGRISGGVASGLSAVSGQQGKLAAISEAGEATHRMSLEMKRMQRESLIRGFESQGMTHGKAIYEADRQLQIQNLIVTVNGDEATVEADGTRAPKVMVRRGERN